jgi:hypothetical protein
VAAAVDAYNNSHASEDPWDDYGDVDKSTTDHNPGKDCEGNCKQCTPPSGTVCYSIKHDDHPHMGLSPHRHVFVMTQDPSCNCRWKPLRKGAGKDGKGAVDHVPAGTIPCPFNRW